MTERDEAREARIRLDAARRHITQAMEAISGPEPDWLRCGAHADMACDVMPVIRRKGAGTDDGEGAR